MCGIVAAYAPGNQVVADRLRAAVDALGHRGPDGQGLWFSLNHEVALGHARLAIIGLDNGVQPIASEDGQIQIVVNGEFYDFERIRAELQAKGHQFRTNSDSEIALHLYEEYGLDCLHSLRGEFAFVLWDGRIERLFAARDRFGIKPLVYAHWRGQLYIASEAKALFGLGLPAQWDEESFYQSASMQYTLPDRTLFANVKQVPPGHYLLAQGSLMQSFPYWDLDYPVEVPHKIADEGELIEQFRFHFSEAVRLRLRADIPVCCHLSGGLDSSSVLAVAMQMSETPLKCFCVTFEEESYDEKHIAAEMASFAGASFHPVLVSQADLVQHLCDAVYFSEGLAVNGHFTAKYLLNNEIRRNGYKVALTGEGSDEVLAGYPHLRHDLFQSDGRQHLLRNLRESNKASQGIMLLHGQSLPLTKVQEKLGFIPAFLEAKGSLGYKMRSLLSEDLKNRFASYDAYDRFLSTFDLQGQVSNRDRVHQSLYLWCKSALPNYILKTLGDGMEMANSVEGRLPFLDHVLFEFLRTLPLSMKIKGTIEKYILKEAAKPWITETIYKRQKHPFVAPPLSLFANSQARSYIGDCLQSQAFATMPFFQHKKVMAAFDSLQQLPDAERAAMDPVLMLLVSAVCMQERFKL